MRPKFAPLLLVASLFVTSASRAQEPSAAEPAAPSPTPSEPAPTAPAPAAQPAAPAPSDPDPAVTPRIALRHDTLLDVVATGAMGATLVTWGFLKKDIGIDKCVICDGAPGTSNAVDEAFRDTFKRDDIGPSALISHIISYAGGPVMGFSLTIGAAAYDKRIDEAPLNCLLVIEASLAAVLVKEGLTAVIRRERPEVHALEGEAKVKAAKESGDPLESFPGGHTASIMAITASSATIATLRGYRLAPLIWIVGSTIATVSMYLRIASDQHYFTDNVAGALVGLGVGAGFPLLFHRRLTSKEQPTGASKWLQGAMVGSSAVNGGRVVNVGWAF